MFKLYCKTIIFLLCGLVASHSASGMAPLGENPNFSHLMTDSKESVGEIRAVEQDALGFIWFAGKNGLARYDGYRYKIYRASPDHPEGITNNNISFVFEDSRENLWLASEGGGVMRYQRETDSFIAYRHENGNPQSLSSDGVYVLYEDTFGDIWAGTYWGVSKYNRSLDRFEAVFQHSPLAKYSIFDIAQISDDEYLFVTLKGGIFTWKTTQEYPFQFLPNELNENFSNTFFSAFRDAQNRIWLGSDNGLYEYIPSTESMIKQDLSSVIGSRESIMITDVKEDSHGVLWLSTDGAGLMYRLDSGLFGGYTPKAGAASALSSFTIRSIFEDSNRDLWIGAFPQGVNFYDRSNNAFKTFRNFALSPAKTYVNNIWGMDEDENGNLWIGTDGAGLVYFDRNTNRFSDEYDGVKFNELFGLQNVLSVHIDDKGYLWAGSWSQGLIRFDLQSKEVKKYHSRLGDETSLQSNNVWNFLNDSKGYLWVSTSDGEGGVNRYDYRSDSFKTYKHIPGKPGSVSNINSWATFEDPDRQELWVGSNTGIDVYQYDTDDFIPLLHDANNPKTVSDPWVTGFFKDSKNRFWVATGGGGLNLFNVETKEMVKVYREKDGLANDAVFRILEDDAGFLWLSTRGGLSRFDPEKQAFTNYGSAHWLQNEQFNINSALKLRSGELVFGGINGITIFDPNTIQKNTAIPPVYITEFKIFDKTVPISKTEGVLNQNILHAEKVVLKPDQSVFSLTFSALNYRAYEKNQYYYRLKGFDEEWIGPTHKNSATFTNLDSGDYVFEVIGSNSEGVWNQNVQSLKVKVLPAIWATWWAYLCYTLIIVGIIAWYVYSSVKIITYQKMTMTNLQHIDRLKDKFVASTSHELRTPLFGIIGLAEMFLEDSKEKLTTAERNTISLIVNSSKRLVAQVNDILDFSKIRENSLTINVRPICLYQLSELVIEISRPLLFNRHISIVNSIPDTFPAVRADDHRLQQVLLNLISNALKFTNEGKIELSAKLQKSEVVVSVTDSGRGIPEDKFDDLFKEFTQIEQADTKIQGGAGLGLAITKKLVELQGGEIWVQSQPNRGSTFNFTLPVSDGDAEDVIISENAAFRSDSLTPTDDAEENTSVGEINTANKHGLKVLIVDDETVNRIVLKAYLKDTDYQVSEAASGEQAISYLDNNHVDLVVLDIMMPGMSGFDVCKRIRKKLSKEALPIIFASAKSQKEDFVIGLEVGGNDFLDKPVSKAEYLKSIEVQLGMQKVYRKLKEKSQ